MQETILPMARRNNLVVQDTSDELLIYDLDRHKAFCLNPTLKLIYGHCDGKTTFEQASAKIRKVIKTDIADQVFWMALEQLKRNHLLDETRPIPDIPKVSRRELIQSGLALSIALPVIVSLIAPSATHAQTNACVELGMQGCSVTFVGENAFDNCCPPYSCTMQVNGFCCIVQIPAGVPGGVCDPNLDFCCPTTMCNPTTLRCVPSP